MLTCTLYFYICLLCKAHRELINNYYALYKFNIIIIIIILKNIFITVNLGQPKREVGHKTSQVYIYLIDRLYITQERHVCHLHRQV